MNSALISVGAAASMLFASAAYADNLAAAKSPSNMVTNGVFSAGNTGFTSDYVYADPSQSGYDEIPETQYEITTSVASVRPNGNWGAGGGPEAGDSFMVVNGATSLNADSTYRNFWADILNLKANTKYKVSFDVANLYSANPAEVTLTLNGDQQGSTYLANGDQGDWTTQSFVFDSGAGGLVKIGLADKDLIAWGNDFAVGDFSVVAVPEPATWAMLILGVAMIGFAARRRHEAAPVAA